MEDEENPHDDVLEPEEHESEDREVKRGDLGDRLARARTQPDSHTHYGCASGVLFLASLHGKDSDTLSLLICSSEKHDGRDGKGHHRMLATTTYPRNYTLSLEARSDRNHNGPWPRRP